MIGKVIAFALGNFTLTFLVVTLLFSVVAIVRAPKPVGRPLAVEKLLSWFVFWTIGVLVQKLDGSFFDGPKPAALPYHRPLEKVLEQR
jgi:hypothetical protein